VSKKRKKQNDEYSVLRKDYLSKFERCEVCKIDAPNQVHHRKGRWGKRLNDSAFFLAVCQDCHNNIHGDPAWAYAMGYLLKR